MLGKCRNILDIHWKPANKISGKTLDTAGDHLVDFGVLAGDELVCCQHNAEDKAEICWHMARRCSSI